MIYSPDEKRNMDSILTAFGDYVQSHSYFDIVYSNKLGYVKIQLEMEELVVIRSVNKLLGVLFDEIINDMRFEGDAEEQDSFALSADESEEARRRIAKILTTLGADADTYLDFLDEYLAAYPDNDIEE